MTEGNVQAELSPGREGGFTPAVLFCSCLLCLTSGGKPPFLTLRLHKV